MSLLSVTLKPIPGFCVKSVILQDGTYATSAPGAQPDKFILGEPFPTRNTIAISKGLKVFVNIAWDPNVPPPPDGVDLAIQKVFGADGDTSSADDWYMPVVISDGRQDKDKAGKPALTFDAVFNSSLKSRALKDDEFKTYIIELALQRIEAQSSLPLSRQISIPNIASKGKLGTRTVRIPNIHGPHVSSHKTHSQGPFIEELPPTPEAENSNRSNTEDILNTSDVNTTVSTPTSVATSPLEKPSWSWVESGDRILITVHVPKLTHSHIPSSTLDLEARRVMINIPHLYSLDIDLDTSNGDVNTSAKMPDSALPITRMRDLDVDGATAQWRVSQGIILLSA